MREQCRPGQPLWRRKTTEIDYGERVIFSSLDGFLVEYLSSTVISRDSCILNPLNTCFLSPEEHATLTKLFSPTIFLSNSGAVNSYSQSYNMYSTGQFWSTRLSSIFPDDYDYWLIFFQTQYFQASRKKLDIILDLSFFCFTGEFLKRACKVKKNNAMYTKFVIAYLFFVLICHRTPWKITCMSCT